MSLEEREIRQFAHMSHYYGDTVRRLFLVGGVIMVFTLAFFKHLLPTPTFVSILLMLIVGFAAGATNPRQKAVIIMNTGIALIVFVVFEYHAVTGYSDASGLLFWITQTLAVVFFFAFYYSTKTLRGVLLKDN